MIDKCLCCFAINTHIFSSAYSKRILIVLSFANYLHPLDNDLLLGVGRNGTSVNIRLFDVSQPEPKLLDTVQIENATHQLAWEQYAICSLEKDAK